MYIIKQMTITLQIITQPMLGHYMVTMSDGNGYALSLTARMHVQTFEL